MNISTEAVSFLWIADPTEDEISKTVDSILNTTQYINDIITEKRYDDVGLFKLMLDNISDESEFIIALINMVIDGHEPFQSSLTNLIFHYIHFKDKGAKEITDKDLINESIRYEPPFSYCARECVEQTILANKTISAGDRLMMILYIGNNNEKSIKDPDNLVCPHSKKDNLSFGYGVHRCLGANITTLSLESFLKFFKQNDEYNNWQVKDYNYQTTYGFIEFKNLYIVSKNEHS
ncbi:cytochrome P450 [Staphylococcus arlettae]|uniref:cytochrome P450 n=1 Tax=Staphylococcus arlettae TaxID=29378 RepID=UPI0002822D60|nr:cytochrome P450 [Staphylococcus arlettae]EJY95758.1 putative Linalool 8-monooxygenase [Staphylococcus arlettae CVD059]MDT3893452.1 cytochrome P450 [Staphylococcus arlettae]